MTPGLPRRPEPVPKPGVIVGDEVYCHHPKGAHAGRVVAHGKHGVTLEGGRHVRWEHVLGHKRRAGQEFKVIDEGEDGCIAEDANGLRQFIAVPPEAREEQMVVKAGMGQRLALFAKADGTPYMGRPGLSKKVITDRRGVQTTRWVRTTPDAPHPQVGHHVGWQNGDVRAHGQVASVGKDGAMVRDKSGGMHAVRHEHVTHHWADKSPPDRSPHEAPDRPSYAPRNDGETDKAYAKRAVDTGDAVHDLPEDHGRYFNDAGAARVPIDRLHSTKSEEENQQGGDNGAKRMLAAYHGVLGKRDPITVMPHATKKGHHEVVDGNGTLTSAKRLGWKSLPVKVVSRDEGLAMKASDAAVEVAKSLDLPKKYGELPKKARQPTKDPDELFAKGEEALQQLKVWLNQGTGVASKMGYKTMTKSPDDVSDEEFEKPGGMLFIARLKGVQRSREKVESAEYGGDWSKLTDVVRCTMATDSLHDVAEAIKTLEKHGLKPMQVPKDKFSTPTDVGYRDFNFIVEMPNGMAAEVQFNVKDMLKAKNAGHHHYEVTRKIFEKHENLKDEKTPETWPEEDRAEYQKHYAAQQKIYNDAWLDHVKKHYGGDSKMVKSVREKVVLWLK